MTLTKIFNNSLDEKLSVKIKNTPTERKTEIKANIQTNTLSDIVWKGA